MDEKRCINEILCLYELEPDLRDVYVEGVTDYLVIERFVSKYKIDNVRIIEVDDIDFNGIYSEYPDIKCNNKKKLLALGDKLSKLYDDTLNGISIIVDKDFDEIRDSIANCKYILYTDYNSLELYLFEPNIIDIFYKNILRRFPFDARQTLDLLGPVLVDKFLIRLALEIKGPYDSDKITDLCKSVEINKKTGAIIFDLKKHLHKILNNLRITKECGEFNNIIEESRKKLSKDIRNNIRGHDFIHLLFTYIDRIKNNIGLTEDVCERSLFQCIDFSNLRGSELFSKIECKYR